MQYWGITLSAHLVLRGLVSLTVNSKVQKFVLELLCIFAESFRGITFYARCNPAYFHIQMSSPNLRAPITGNSTVASSQ